MIAAVAAVASTTAASKELITQHQNRHAKYYWGVQGRRKATQRTAEVIGQPSDMVYPSTNRTFASSLRARPNTAEYDDVLVIEGWRTLLGVMGMSSRPFSQGK